jgi:hypothetical protein
MNVRTKLVGIAALAIAGAGVAAGLALSGGATRPVVVQHVDQAVVVSTDVVPLPAVPAAVSSSSAAVVAAPSPKAARVTQPAVTEDAAPPVQRVDVNSLTPGAPIPPLVVAPVQSPQGTPVLPSPR